jgi:hypothetical protein
MLNRIGLRNRTAKIEVCVRAHWSSFHVLRLSKVVVTEHPSIGHPRRTVQLVLEAALYDPPQPDGLVVTRWQEVQADLQLQEGSIVQWNRVAKVAPGAPNDSAIAAPCQEVSTWTRVVPREDGLAEQNGQQFPEGVDVATTTKLP